MTTTTPATHPPTRPRAEPLLPAERLDVFRERAAAYDRENRFCTEDFEDLRTTGYLTAPVPEELGGMGLTLSEMCLEQRRLAYHAAPTALAVNMHLYWVGLAADLWRAGDHSLEWLLKEATGGKIFAAGHAESGNDIPVLLSTTTAEKVDGGYRFTGRKSFGSLSPVWDYMGIHGMDLSEPTQPRIVHAYMPRDADGFRVEEVWDDVLGMRATRSDNTVLDGVFVPDRLVARVVPAGFAGVDTFVLGVFAWALIGFGNIYHALGRRILDETLEHLRKKTSLGISRGSMIHHAGIQSAVAEMVMALDTVEPLLDRVAREWDEGTDHGAMWGPRIFTAKHAAVEAAWKVADTALDVMGGFGIFPASGLERLVRDCRLGRIHPANSFLTREIVGKLTLGVNPDEQPRWG